MLIPQFMTDVAFSWNARGTPENQYKAKLDKYLKGRAKEMELPKEEAVKWMENAKNIVLDPKSFGQTPDQAVELQAALESASKNVLGENYEAARRNLEKATVLTDTESAAADKDLESGSTGQPPKPARITPEPAALLTPGSQKASELPLTRTGGEIKKSRAFERTKARLDELSDEPDATYHVMDRAEDAAKGSRLVEEQPEIARRVALGLEPPPNGVTDTAVSIAYAEHMRDQENWHEVAQSVRSRSLRQTRRGQELSAEQGAVNEHSTDSFIKRVLTARLEQAGKPLLVRAEKGKGEAQKAKSKAVKSLEAETVKLKEIVDSKALDLSEAQKIIDSIIC
jgi:hypothetical protein